MVQDGLKELDESVVKIRNAVRYVRSSPSRLLAFKQCVEKEKIEAKSSLCLDVETRWNSTYLMLEAAEKYEKAFERLLEDESKYVLYFDSDKCLGPSEGIHWQNVRVLIKFLRMFYQVTLKFSRSLYVTSNIFFHEIVEIHARLTQLSKSNDTLLSSMANRMKIKFAKYWEDASKINKLLFIAVVLDPRFKLKYVEFCLFEIYDMKKASELFVSIETALNRLFKFYEDQNPSRSDDFFVELDDMNDGMVDDDYENSNFNAKKFLQQIKEQEQVEHKSELFRYLNDNHLTAVEPFDVLGYWKLNENKYPCLSMMAREILAIPISPIFSESTFRTSGRIFYPYQSSLMPKTLEALLCT